MNNNKNIHLYKNSLILGSCPEYFGAYFTSENDIIFKFFTFPEVKQVYLEIKPHNKDVMQLEMTSIGEGRWYLRLENGLADNGDRYRFVFEHKGELVQVKDPCSMWQDTYYKWSKLYNHNLFNWTDYDWIGSNNPKRISRHANIHNGLSGVNSLRIYELHLGTFTKEGTYKSAKEKLSHLVNDLHFNAIEIMPVENTYSFNWGYDGVDKYAPNHVYGTPDELKELIDYAHSLKLNVIMDIVPNHLGPDIAELQRTGPYTAGDNCFGFRFNYEGDKNSIYVRYFMIGAALNWIINYHCDGLRVDMTKFMDSDFIKKISDNEISLSALGFDTEWDFPFHKQIASSVLGSWDCRIKNLSNFDFSLRDAQTRVKYAMSHDEIGNVDGTRLITKIVSNELGMNKEQGISDIPGLSKLIAHSAHKIITMFVCILLCLG